MGRVRDSSGQHGLSIFTNERLLLNTPEGLVILDLATGTAECPASPTRVAAAKALSNGAIAVVLQGLIVVAAPRRGDAAAHD